jgi:hypothetical protein
MGIFSRKAILYFYFDERGNSFVLSFLCCDGFVIIIRLVYLIWGLLSHSDFRAGWGCKSL